MSDPVTRLNAALQEEVMFSAADFERSVFRTAYDVAPDDQRFIMTRRVGVAESGRVIWVQGFFEELKERMEGR